MGNWEKFDEIGGLSNRNVGVFDVHFNRRDKLGPKEARKEEEEKVSKEVLACNFPLSPTREAGGRHVRRGV